ncbi:LysE family transporter [Thermovirga lienii]|uniref:LysE family transporter n=1 Tax=Thermovirga lienii TaxID=336261 RepID=UPI002FE15422
MFDTIELVGDKLEAIKIFKNGLLTGLILQAAIGPVFFFVVSLVLQAGAFAGLAAVAAVTMVDYLYITLAILGVGKLLEKDKFKRIFGLVSSVVLILFGLSIAASGGGVGFSSNLVPGKWGLISSFASAFILTISSPLTIVFFTGLFAAKALEHDYKKRELWIFGLSAGSATFLFLGTSVVLFSMFAGSVPASLVKVLNLIVGALLVFYGLVRGVKIFRCIALDSCKK